MIITPQSGILVGYLLGFDWRGEFGSFYPFAQVMTGWDGKDIKDRKNIFYGGFLGIDKIFSKDAKTRGEDLLLHPQESENYLGC